ncbi:MAG: putative protein YqeN [Chloroflexi bacterium]|nr:putative protein YqeN [Chloroflexota bacterium]
MSKTKPTIYLFYGDDEYALQGAANMLKAKVAQSGSVDMNVTTLDGSTTTLEKLTSITHVMPFLAERRAVILVNPLALSKGSGQRKKFLSALETIPPSTACMLKVERDLKPSHWLLKWAREQGGRVFVKAYPLPKGHNMTRWIQDKARESGGEFSRQGAARLAVLVNENPRMAAKEIEKLLAYANYERPVTAEDVDALTPDVRPGDVFAMVDAIGYRNSEKATRMLHRLLAESHPLQLYGMIIRQFRLLIQVREELDKNPRANYQDIAKKMGSHPYPIKKIIPQTRFFTLKSLEKIYHQLLETDEDIKTGKIEPTLAMDILIAELTG